MSTQMGPCASCRQTTTRYGFGGNPLCTPCRKRVTEAQAKK